MRRDFFSLHHRGRFETVNPKHSVRKWLYKCGLTWWCNYYLISPLISTRTEDREAESSQVVDCQLTVHSSTEAEGGDPGRQFNVLPRTQIFFLCKPET